MDKSCHTSNTSTVLSINVSNKQFLATINVKFNYTLLNLIDNLFVWHCVGLIKASGEKMS
jgi:hypothetical protein